MLDQCDWIFCFFLDLLMVKIFLGNMFTDLLNLHQKLSTGARVISLRLVVIDLLFFVNYVQVVWGWNQIGQVIRPWPKNWIVVLGNIRSHETGDWRLIQSKPWHTLTRGELLIESWVLAALWNIIFFVFLRNLAETVGVLGCIMFHDWPITTAALNFTLFFRVLTLFRLWWAGWVKNHYIIRIL